MRISTQAFQTRTLEMIQQKTAEIAKTQAQIASGERLTRAGDDPAAAAWRWIPRWSRSRATSPASVRVASA